MLRTLTVQHRHFPNSQDSHDYHTIFESSSFWHGNHFRLDSAASSCDVALRHTFLKFTSCQSLRNRLLSDVASPCLGFAKSASAGNFLKQRLKSSVTQYAMVLPGIARKSPCFVCACKLSLLSNASFLPVSLPSINRRNEGINPSICVFVSPKL